MDDLLIVRNRKDVSKVKRELARQFTSTELGPYTHFIGIAVEQSRNCIFLSLRPFTNRLVRFASLATSKSALTFLDMSHSLNEKEAPLTDVDCGEVRNVPYRSVIGSPLNLSKMTRPDIAMAVSMLPTF